jgi:hypothetical protein
MHLACIPRRVCAFRYEALFRARFPRDLMQAFDTNPMDISDTMELFQRLGVALAIGLLIGIERGWK